MRIPVDAGGLVKTTRAIFPSVQEVSGRLRTAVDFTFAEGVGFDPTALAPAAK
jgi:hypothetical protein